jgi:dTDP-glucose 4,6-dehydratase
MRIVVTGGAGFIGSNFVRWVVEHQPKVHVTTLDALTYAGNLANLEGLPPDRHEFVHGDIRRPDVVDAVLGRGVDAVVHFAAESHVDRSILSAADFVSTNVQGTQNLLDAVRRHGVGRFVHVSTDEVYGSLGPADPPFRETDPLRPNSPYAASKAASDLLVLAAVHTFGLPAVITRCSNNYGPYQFPEKFIPLFITNALEGAWCPLYGDGLNVRDWIHVEDHVRAVWTVLEQGRVGEVYNIGGQEEHTNREVAETVLRLVGRDPSLIRPVADRPGHDRRYAMNAGKMAEQLNWRPRISFQEGLATTVAWYRTHEEWWRAVKSGAYRAYYQAQYGARLP